MRYDLDSFEKAIERETPSNYKPVIFQMTSSIKAMHCVSEIQALVAVSSPECIYEVVLHDQVTAKAIELPMVHSPEYINNRMTAVTACDYIHSNVGSLALVASFSETSSLVVFHLFDDKMEQKIYLQLSNQGSSINFKQILKCFRFLLSIEEDFLWLLLQVAVTVSIYY